MRSGLFAEFEAVRITATINFDLNFIDVPTVGYYGSGASVRIAGNSINDTAFADGLEFHIITEICNNDLMSDRSTTDYRLSFGGVELALGGTAGTNLSDHGASSAEIEIVIKHPRLFVEDASGTATWRLDTDGLTWDISIQTRGAGTLTATGDDDTIRQITAPVRGPTSAPVFGLFLFGQVVAIPFHKRLGPVGRIEWSTSLEMGYEYQIGGTWYTLPATVDYTAPGVDAFGIAPTLTVTDTSSATLTAYGVLDDLQIETPDSYDTIAVLLLPNRDRRYVRHKRDNETMVYRTSLARVAKYRIRESRGSFSFRQRVSNVELHPKHGFLLTVLPETVSANETELYNETTFSPYFASCHDIWSNYSYIRVEDHSAGDPLPAPLDADSVPQDLDNPVFSNLYQDTRFLTTTPLPIPVHLQCYAAQRASMWHWLLYFPPDSDSAHWKLGVPLEKVESWQYWIPIRQQYIEHAALPGKLRTQRRNDLIDAGITHTSLPERVSQVFVSAVGGAPVFVPPEPTCYPGLAHARLLSVSPNTDAHSRALSRYTASNATMANGVSSITVTPTTTSPTLTYEVGGYADAPYIYDLWATHCDWQVVGANVTNTRIVAIDFDGHETELHSGSSLSGTLIKSLAQSVKYAGSWAQDYDGDYVHPTHGEVQLDYGNDLQPAGISADVMTDTRGVTNFQLIAGLNWRQLRFEFTLSNTDSFAFTHLRWHNGSGVEAFFSLYETANQSIQFSDRRWWRAGNLHYYNPLTLQLRDVPTIGKPHQRLSFIDWMALLRGLYDAESAQEADSEDVRAELETLYAVEEAYPYDIVDNERVFDRASGISPFSTDTYAFVRVDRANYSATGLTLIYGNYFAELPPISTLPQFGRDEDYNDLTDLSVETVSLSNPTRRYVIAHSQTATLYRVEFDGSTEVSRVPSTAIETGYGDWRVTSGRIAVNNSETRRGWDGAEIETPRFFVWQNLLGDVAQCTPFHGSVAILGGATGKKGNWVSYDISESQRHYRAFVDTGTIWVGRNENLTATDWLDADTGVAGSRPCIRVALLDGKMHRWLLYEDSGIQLTSSIEGGAWAMPTTITTDGEYPALVAARDGRLLCYYITSGDIRGKIYDQRGGLVVSEFTAVSSVDDSPIAADEYVTGSGQWRANLLYRNAGALELVSSIDGVNFS